MIELLATIRLTRLIVEDKITEPLRDEVGGRWPESPLVYLINCWACTSVWAAAVVVLLRCSRLGRALLRMLALSEGVIAMRALTEWLEERSSETS